MPKKKKDSSSLKIIEKAITELQPLANDQTLPKNIRNIITEAINALKDEKLAPYLRASNAISILEELDQQQRIPPYILTIVYRISADLDTVK